jgi:Family of unknown function (DUF5681)
MDNGQFKKGQSGNPKGRPKGSKNLLTNASVIMMLEHFAENGEAAMNVAFREKPSDYVRTMVALVSRLMTNEAMQEAPPVQVFRWLQAGEDPGSPPIQLDDDGHEIIN